MKVLDYIGKNQATSIFGMYLRDNIAEDSNIQILTSDMSAAANLEMIQYRFPDKYTDVGIAEQNMLGVCAGLASEGFRPIATAQANFLTMRAFEMDRQFMGYMRKPIILVGINSGFLLQFMGNTHFAIEDVALMRMIPNMTVLSPADGGAAAAAMDAALKYDGPVYIRLTGMPGNTVYDNECDFTIGKDIILREGDDVTIFASGSMVYFSLKAAELLESDYGINAKVVDVHTLKPIDIDAVKESKKSRLFVTVEEHSIIGGLGSAISDIISAEAGYPSLLKLGVQDKFSTLGDYNYLLKQHRLTPELIETDIATKYQAL